MKRLYFIVVFVVSLAAYSQRPTQPSAVCIQVGDSLYEVSAEQTQTEISPGWKIVDIKLKDKTIRYLWGRHAKQIASKSPVFVIDVRNDQLFDFAILKLENKKQYRKFPHPEISQCHPQRIDIDWMKIEMLKDERYRISPISPLESGEYVIVKIKAPVVNEYGDFEVYPFLVE